MARWWNATMSDPAPTAVEPLATWSGELLWPQPLPEGMVIDLSSVTALGCWVHAWFRARPQLAVSGASAALRRQLLRAGVPVRWRDLPRQAGVGRDERAALFDAP